MAARIKRLTHCFHRLVISRMFCKTNGLFYFVFSFSPLWKSSLHFVDMHTACHGCRPWITILCLSQLVWFREITDSLFVLGESRKVYRWQKYTWSISIRKIQLSPQKTDNIKCWWDEYLEITYCLENAKQHNPVTAKWCNFYWKIIADVLRWGY